MKLEFGKTWEHGEKYGAQLVFCVQHKKTFRDCISKGNTILQHKKFAGWDPTILSVKNSMVVDDTQQ